MRGEGETLDERYDWLLRTSTFPKGFNIFILDCGLFVEFDFGP
jgi:hypothetical protein